MAGNQQKSTQIVLPPCCILINEVDSADFKAAQLTPLRLRILHPQIMPLQQRPEGHPPYTRATDDDTRSIPDLDSYHADDETSDSEDVSPCALTSDDSGSSSDDSLRTPQFLSSGVLARKLPSTAKRRQLRTPKARVKTKLIQSSHIMGDLITPSPVELSSTEAYSPLSTGRPNPDAPFLFDSPTEPSSYFQKCDILTSTAGELSCSAADSPRIPNSDDGALARQDVDISELETGKNGAQGKKPVTPEHATPPPFKGSAPPCSAEHCLKAHYISALFEHSGRLPSRTPPSLTPSLASSRHSPARSSNRAGHATSARNSARSPAASPTSSTDSTNGSASIRSSSTAPSLADNDSCKLKPPRRAHAPLDIVNPAVTFSVPYSDGATKTFGIAVSDIFEYEGVYMLRANDSMSPLWEYAAPGTAINLMIHWKGHAEEKGYPIVVKCDCGFIIRRSQLALALAKAQVSYFATSDLDPAYIPPADNPDPFHPSNFITKDHHNLHLMSLFTPDNGKTWRTNHAIVEDPSTLTVDPEPERTPSGQLVIPNARVLLAVRRLQAREDMRAQEKLRIQELKAQKKREVFERWKARQEAKAQKELAAQEQAKAKKQAKIDAKAKKSKNSGLQHDMLALGCLSCRMIPGRNCKCEPHGGAQTPEGDGNRMPTSN